MPASRRRPPRIRPIRWVRGAIRILDQTLLPEREVYRTLRTAGEVIEAIRTLRVRGAPLIGVAAAYGMVLGGPRAAKAMAAARPTAVNLGWAVERMVRAGCTLDEARVIHEEDADFCRRIGEAGALVARGNALTICNTGHLATGGTGTAFSVLLHARPRKIYACETRPVGQGARLTMWEAQKCGLNATLICDGAAASLMAAGEIGFVVTGADRIARNGDSANKIGTYALAVLARAHKIPFYIAAPTSTVDASARTGRDIPIEYRDPAEITRWTRRALNPAFDVTPARLISGWITERGVVRPPFRLGR